MDYYCNGVLGKQYWCLSCNLKWLCWCIGLCVYDFNLVWLWLLGWVNSLVFKFINLVVSVQGYWNLVKNLYDWDFVSVYVINGVFLNDMVVYSGGVIQDIIYYLWVDNVVVCG